MNRAFIISRQDSIADTLRRTLQNLGFDSISEILTGSEARRIIRNGNPPDLIIINTPLTDEFGNELAETAAEETNTKTILLCSGNIADELADRLSEYDILVLSKPVDRDVLRRGICLLEADGAPFSDIDESDEVLRRIDDIRLISKAKAALMKCKLLRSFYIRQNLFLSDAYFVNSGSLLRSLASSFCIASASLGRTPSPGSQQSALAAPCSESPYLSGFPND